MRTILAGIYVFFFLLLGIPVLAVDWIIRKFNPKLSGYCQLRIVQWGFRCISFLSGCTVLTMSVVSVYKNMRAGKKLNLRIATLLAVGAAVGGVAGKMMFVAVKTSVGNENFVGMVQAIVLIGVTGITFVYTIFKKKIHKMEE